jgi:hypothetical protein
MKFDKIFHCTRSEKNIPYFYYTARKYPYLSIFDLFLNILTNLQSKIDRLTADSAFITENVIIQLARDLNLRIRCAEKEIRGALLSEIENSSSLENVLHLLFHTIKKSVKLFTETVNFLFQYLLTVALSDNRIRKTI